MVLGIIGIVVALALFMFLVYKGYSILYIAPICVLIVAVTNELSPLVSVTTTYVTGIIETFLSLFSMVFLGMILGKIMQATGGAASIAAVLSKHYIFKTDDQEKRIVRMVISVAIMYALLSFGGIDGYTCLFVGFPICMLLAKKLNLPKKIVPSLLSLGVAYIVCPGAPQPYHIMAQGAFASVGILDTKATDGLVPGLIGVAVILIGGIVYSISYCKKANKTGEGFSWGACAPLPEEQDEKHPHIICAIIPLISVFVLYTIIDLDIAIALTVGILLALVLMGRFIDTSKAPELNKWQHIKRALNEGAEGYPLALVQLCTPAGLAAVITATAAFGVLIGFVSGLPIHYIFITVIGMLIITAITSSPIVGLMITIPLVMGVVQAQGIDANVAAIFRVAVLGAATLETLPTNGMVTLQMGLVKTTHKESYKPIFLQTCLWTTIGTIVCALIYFAFPGLA